jgi:single-stranded-DNA-specific exonuclease
VRWTLKTTSRADATALSSRIGVRPSVAALLCGLGYSDETLASEFLNPRLQRLEDPFAVANMDRAVCRTLEALRGAQHIVVFGDYDVDGVTSTAFLVHILGRLGAKIRYLLPRRLDEGYGLSRSALERMIGEGRPDLLIAADCGTNSRDEIQFLREKGIDIIVIDHHTGRDAACVCEGEILVNPHICDGEKHPWSNLCTAGLVFKFAHALLKQLREEGDAVAMKIDLREYLDLVALGTIADLVPLTGENRILASKGLERMGTPHRIGLLALYSVSGIQPDQPITPFDVSFRLSPRINVSGRLSDARAAVEMLLSDDMVACVKTAQSFDEMNRSRQNIERDIAQAAIKIVEAHYADDPALVLYDQGWHPGVVGIVASRIANHFHRPTVVLGAESGGSFLKGSGRSADGIDMIEVLGACSAHLAGWGGHPFAVGVTVAASKLDEFRAAFCQSVAARRSVSAERVLEIACALMPEELAEDLFEAIDKLGPFGKGNPQPVLAVCDTKIISPVTTFGDGHCRFSIETYGGRTVPCVAWRSAQNLPPKDTPLDLAAILTWNVWKGRRTPQLQIEDWRPHEESITPDVASRRQASFPATARKLR